MGQITLYCVLSLQICCFEQMFLQNSYAGVQVLVSFYCVWNGSSNIMCLPSALLGDQPYSVGVGDHETTFGMRGKRAAGDSYWAYSGECSLPTPIYSLLCFLFISCPSLLNVFHYSLHLPFPQHFHYKNIYYKNI